MTISDPKCPELATLFKNWMAGRSLVEAAEVLNLGVSTVHNYVHGLSKPRRRQIPELANRMGVPEEQLRAVVEAA